MTDTVKLSDFIRDNRISMTAERIDRNPHNPDWQDADHWKVVFCSHATNPLKTGRLRKMTTYFSMGYGHHGAGPEAKDVLSCIADDSASVDRESFEEWASNLGYDPDSRKAEKIYKACEHGAARLKRFLGADLYETLLYGTERE